MAEDLGKIAQTLHPLERKVFPLLSKYSNFSDLVKGTGLQDIEVLRALQWLNNKKLITLKEELTELIALDENGELYKKNGLPEKKFLECIKEETTFSSLKETSGLSPDECTVCMGLLKRNDLITISKQGQEIMLTLTEKGKAASKTGFSEQKFLSKHFPLEVKSLSKEEQGILSLLRQRKKIVKSELSKKISATLTPLGTALSQEKISDDVHDRVTPDLLSSGNWETASFRRFDISANVPAIHGGKRHYVEQSIQYIKRIWLDLGFTEMEGKMVQTSFWDLDALFVPQDHPAREMQDTFYLEDPKSGKLPKALSLKIKAMHENGGDTGSRGWGGEWSWDLASQNLLRTHTTVLSAQTISKLKESDLPVKFFTVGRVFRNEALSWKHLFEFTQVEGIVVDPDANLKHLKGYLMEFFKKMGFEKIRIRPGHFPYTEPSAEVDVWHPTKKIWVELGGAGIFRPEVVVPLIGKDIPVLAWGIGMERSIMEYYGFSDVRLLYQNDLKNLRESKLWMK
ncbi:MAG TPA: phenylalanine--tRNA ligase subunit alpha [Candidatus Nanoarchaeia archaeon]|nr:phenylalanine--tRNA ligase subunit alpha [Candidatus Nanoarchaeia archaeon]